MAGSVYVTRFMWGVYSVRADLIGSAWEFFYRCHGNYSVPFMEGFYGCTQGVGG